MKRIKFVRKEDNSEKVVMVRNIGECVFAVCQNVKETNDAIRWCNTHNIGDTFDCDLYTLKITE